MKRISCLFLIALFVFAAACGAPHELNTQNADWQETDSSETKGEAAFPVPSFELPEISVPHPLTKQDLDSLPTATAKMTEDELRDVCVRFFELSGTFQWTPSDSVSYVNLSNTLSFQRGVVYGGLPYTHSSLSIYSFLDHYDEETGVLDTAPYKMAFDGAFGNDCADALFWAWARISNTISFTGTKNMQPARGCLLLGDYRYDTSISSFQRLGGTVKICEENGEQTMFKAYSLLKKADGVVCWNEPNGGHAMMVIENETVSNADGTVNGDESRVTVIEQVSSLTPTDQDGVSVLVECGYHNTVTYSDLFSKRGYLPITIAELAGTDPVEKAEAILEVAENADFDTLTAAELKTNYRLAKVDFTIQDASGALLYSWVKNGSEDTMYSVRMSDVLSRAAIRRSLKGEGPYTLNITATVGTGETLDVYTGVIASV